MRDLEQQFGNALVVVGVHSPKFDTERSDSHVKEAILRYHLDHPVVNDAGMSLWRALGVQAWPSVILVDPDGYAVAEVSGEGVKDALLPQMQTIAHVYRAAGRLDIRPLALSLEASHQSGALLSFPGKVLADGKQLFIADSGHNRIVIAGLDGRIQQTIGSGRRGRADGPYDRASFSSPQGMALVGTRLYVADTNNHLIRAIDLARSLVTTVAGTGKQEGMQPGTGPQSIRTPLEMDLSSPWDMNWLNGALYVAMAGDHRIWRYDPEQNRISVFVGSGQEARQDGPGLDAAFAQPSGLANDGANLYVADSESSSIRKVDLRSGQVSTLAGGDLFDFGHKDAVGTEARFQHPLGIAYADGKLYVADTYNNDIRVLDPGSSAVTTLAGSTVAGDADGRQARFFEPGGLSFSNGLLYVADTDNGAIRTVDPATGITSTLRIARSEEGGKLAPSGGEAAVNADTGITGTVYIGPVTPSQRVGDPNHRPYAAVLELRSGNGALVKTIRSGPDGRFSVAVPAGKYTLGPADTGRPFLPRAAPVAVTVMAHQLAIVTIEVDSGIR